MKKLFLIVLSVFMLPLWLQAQQTPTQVMQKAREKCLAITNGKYTLVRKFKYFSSPDTIVQYGEIVFDKAPSDSLFGLHFWLANNTDSFSRNYSGTIMCTIDHKKKNVTLETTETIETTETVEAGLSNATHGNLSYGYLRFPYTDTLPMPILGDTAYKTSIDPAYKNNKDTVVVLVILPTDKGKTAGDDWVRWYFDVKSGYPIAKEVKLVDDNEIQYEYFQITSYKFNDTENLNLMKNSLKWPIDYAVDTKFTKGHNRLPNDTIAPDWIGETLAGDSIQLSKLKAKLYLVDFWYQACGPCVKAMPSLQALHKKYEAQGLRVIGLNPYDYKIKDTEQFKNFMERRNIDYTIAFVNINVPRDLYRISGYPTFYLIGGDGKIVHSLVGYGEGVEVSIDRIIREYLATH